MQGTFPNSIIIMMGCTGLKNSNMAQAFVSKGAKVYLSWDKSVTTDRTDEGTTAFLHSLASGKNVKEAVDSAMSEVGSDPVFNSRLSYYPDNQATLVMTLGHDAMTTNAQVSSQELDTRATKYGVTYPSTPQNLAQVDP
jgi:hypothetical protein